MILYLINSVHFIFRKFMEEKELRRVFNCIDMNHSGSLDFKECKKFFEFFSYPGPQLLAILVWQILGKNEKDTLTFEDYKGLFSSINKLSEFPDKIYSKSFELFDYDHSGSIEYREILKIVAKFGLINDFEKEANYYMQRFDRDHNGRLDKQEFLKFIKVFGEDID